MTKDLPPSRTAEQFVVRFPEGMRDRIAEAAKKNNRSMNAEIVARLDRTFSDAPAVNGISMSAIFEKLEEIESSIKTGKFPGAKTSKT